MFDFLKRKQDTSEQGNMQLPAQAAVIKNNTKRQTSSSVIIYWICLSLVLLGVAIVFLFDAKTSGKATVFAWMMACLLSGIFVGFLFGIPKILQGGNPTQTPAPATGVALPVPNTGQASNPTPSSGNNTPMFTYQQQVNTNLTEISDWLTKIIVGLGLVNLTKIHPHLAAAAKILADALSQNEKTVNPLATAFAYGVIISYVILGFLFGYISTRLYLAGAFLDADRRSLDLSQLTTKAEEAKAAAESADRKAQLALAQTPAAQEEIRGPLIPGQHENKLEELITEYNNIRSNLPFGDLRTSRMTDIAARMTIVAPSIANFNVPAALKDVNNGRRLAGYAYLFSKPDYAHLAIVVDSVLTDPTQFGQYWAIQAFGKIYSLKPSEQIPPELYRKLKVYYDSLPDGVDRKFELGKILPSLKK